MSQAQENRLIVPNLYESVAELSCSEDAAPVGPDADTGLSTAALFNYLGQERHWQSNSVLHGV